MLRPLAREAVDKSFWTRRSFVMCWESGWSPRVFIFSAVNNFFPTCCTCTVTSESLELEHLAFVCVTLKQTNILRHAQIFFNVIVVINMKLQQFELSRKRPECYFFSTAVDTYISVKRQHDLTPLTRGCEGLSASAPPRPAMTWLQRLHPAASRRQPWAPEPTSDSQGPSLDGQDVDILGWKKGINKQHVNTMTKKNPWWTLFRIGCGCLTAKPAKTRWLM